VSLYSLLDLGCKMWSVRVLPSGGLDGNIWFGSLSGHLVSNGRQAPWKRAKLGDSATRGRPRAVVHASGSGRSSAVSAEACQMAALCCVRPKNSVPRTTVFSPKYKKVFKISRHITYVGTYMEH
jgi:hypothetical protein